MKKGINLTLGRKRVDSALRKVFVASIGLFFVTVVVSLGLLTYSLILKSSFDSLDQKEQQLNGELLGLTEKNDKFTETKSRIGEIKKILTFRAPIITRMDILSETIPPDAEVNSITGNDIDMELNLESDSLSSLNDLVEQKIAQIASDKKKRIKKAEMKSFGLNPKTLKYNIALGITFE